MARNPYLDSGGLSHLIDKIKAALSGKVNISGGTITGPLTIKTAAPKALLLQKTDTSIAGSIAADENGNLLLENGSGDAPQIKNVAAPTDAADAANKQYVDDNAGEKFPDWVAFTMPSTNIWQSVTYGNGKFVAVSIGENVAYSTGTFKTGTFKWNISTLPSSASWQSVTYGNGKFVAVARNSTTAAYSTDGVTWTASTMPSSANWYSVTYGNGKFVAVVNSSTVAAYSTDGITWTATTLPSSASWQSVTYGNGKFVAVATGNKAAYSTNGITWTATMLPDTASWNSVTYGNGKFVAVARSSSGIDKAAYSTDGITWTATTLPSSANWYSVTYGNGKFVAVVNNSNKAAYSTDGITWTASTMPSAANWQSVTYGNGEFVAVTNGTTAAYAAVPYVTFDDLEGVGAGGGGSGGGGGVTSFKGRTGAVTPMAGDYTAEQVGALPATGGTLTGDLRIKGSGNYGTKINLGDGDYVHFSEPTDDCLEIKAKKINFLVSDTSDTNFTLNGAKIIGGSASGTPVSAQENLSTSSFSWSESGSNKLSISSGVIARYGNLVILNFGASLQPPSPSALLKVKINNTLIDGTTSTTWYGFGLGNTIQSPYAYMDNSGYVYIGMIESTTATKGYVFVMFVT